MVLVEVPQELYPQNSGLFPDYGIFTSRFSDILECWYSIQLPVWFIQE